MSRRPSHLFLQTFILGCLAASCENPSVVEDRSSPLDPAVPRVSLAEDLTPTYLPSAKTALEPARLVFGETVELRLGQTLPQPLGIAFTNSTIFVFQRFRRSTVWSFDYRGKLLSQVHGPDRLAAAAELAVSPDGEKIFVTDPAKSVSEYDNRFRLLRTFAGPTVQTVAGLAAGGGNEAAIFSLFPDYGFYLGMLAEDGTMNRFHAERTPVGDSPESYRYNLLPFVYTDVDSAGNIYSVEHVRYEVRTYDPQGRYTGDFRIQSDEDYYVAPPGGVDKLRLQLDAAFRKEWSSSWTAVQQAVVADNRYLVVSLGPNREGGYRLHFYTLGGSPAFAPLTVKDRLMGRDREGRLYFLQSSDPESLRLKVCSIGGGKT